MRGLALPTHFEERHPEGSRDGAPGGSCRHSTPNPKSSLLTDIFDSYVRSNQMIRWLSEIMDEEGSNG
jgi:hypothetical protein